MAFLKRDLHYTTCDKEYIEKYRIDINYLDKVLTLEPKIENELSALKNINKSIVSLSEQFI